MVNFYGKVNRVCLCVNPKPRKGYGRLDRLRCTKCHADIMDTAKIAQGHSRRLGCAA